MIETLVIVGGSVALTAFMGAIMAVIHVAVDAD
jgi:hypothetical protein